MIRLASGLGTAGLLSLVPVALPGQTPDFELRRELDSGARFVLRNIIGDVRLEGTSGRTLEVRAIKREGRHGDPEDVEIRSLEIDGGVAVCVYYPGHYRDDDDDRRRQDRSDDRYERDDDERDRDRGRRSRTGRARRNRGEDICNREHGWDGNHRNDTSVEFTIRVPAGLRLDAKTVSGDVVGQGLRGELDLATVSGDLQLTDLQAGVLDAHSVSGNVELDGVRAREVAAETVSGDVTYIGEIDRDGNYDFKTLSGDVVVTLPREPDAQLSAATFSGDFRSDFPTQSDSRRRRNRFNATWGAGTARIDVQSFSGDIDIRSRR